MATVHIAGAVPSPPMTVVVVATAARARHLTRLMSSPGFEIAGTSKDPEAAERMVAEHRPAAVLLDLDLLDGGLEAIERIMATRPTPIVVSGEAASQPQAALAAGAVDVIGPLDGPPGAPEYAQALVRHLRSASRVPVITHPRARLRARHNERVETSRAAKPLAAATGAPADASPATVAPDGPATPPAAPPAAPPPARSQRARASDGRRSRPLVVAIGASTGGPPALATILRGLPADLPAAIVIAQHMAEGFVEGLARWLDEAAALSVHVARAGEQLQPGTVYLAPAGLNLALGAGCHIELSVPPVGQYHIPGVDVTFTSVAEQCGSLSVGVLLTGMGRDGARGLLAMRAAGARTLGQDEATSVVWGMPQAAKALGAVDLELSLPEISGAIVRAVDDCLGAHAESEAGS